MNIFQNIFDVSEQIILFVWITSIISSTSVPIFLSGLELKAILSNSYNSFSSSVKSSHAQTILSFPLYLYFPKIVFCTLKPTILNILLPTYSEYALFIYDIFLFFSLIGSGNLTKYLLLSYIKVFFFSDPLYLLNSSIALVKSIIFSSIFLIYYFNI